VLIAYLYDSHGNSQYSSPTPPAFAPRTGIADTTRARTRAVAIHYFGNWDDRFALGSDWFAIDGFDARLAENAFLQ
jgi:hypothetical protein